MRERERDRERERERSEKRQRHRQRETERLSEGETEFLMSFRPPFVDVHKLLSCWFSMGQGWIISQR